MASGNGRIKLAQELYEVILAGANKFLHDCSTFQIQTLQNANPSLDEIAHRLEVLSKAVIVLCDSTDVMMGQKAAEYCLLMRQMAVAVKDGDEAKLRHCVEEMKQKPGV